MMCCQNHYFDKMEKSFFLLYRSQHASCFSASPLWAAKLEISLLTQSKVVLLCSQNDYLVTREKRIFEIMDGDNYHRLVFFQQEIPLFFDV